MPESAAVPGTPQVGVFEETKDAIEDMEFQITQNKAQKENMLAVLSGETTYLKEHQVW